MQGASTSDAQLGNRASGTVLPDPIVATGPGLTVQLTSDGSVTQPGIAASFVCGSPAAPSPPAPPPALGETLCSGYTALTDAGDFGGTYGHSTACTWVLSCTTGSPHVEFSAFDLESNFDFVYVYDGGSASSAALGSPLHGTSIPGSVTATGSSLFIELNSDGSVAGSGFTATLTCAPTPAPSPPSLGNPCAGGGVAWTDSATLDGSHSNNAVCTWALSCTDPARVAQVSFSAFDLESNFDFVYVHDGGSASAAEVVGSPLHGASVPAPVTASGAGGLFLRLTSDGSVAGSGFTATLTCAPTPAPSPPSLGNPCAGGGVAWTDSATLDGSHSNNAVCTWALSCTDPARVAQVSFSAFDLESNFDFVYVHDGGSASAAEVVGSPLHGASVPAPVTASGAGGLFLRLTSDGSVAGSGFTATLACVTAGSGRRLLAAGQHHSRIKALETAAETSAAPVTSRRSMQEEPELVATGATSRRNMQDAPAPEQPADVLETANLNGFSYNEKLEVSNLASPHNFERFKC